MTIIFSPPRQLAIDGVIIVDDAFLPQLFVIYDRDQVLHNTFLHKLIIFTALKIWEFTSLSA